MIEKYDLLLEHKKVGTAHVQRQGLYFRFKCRCDFEAPGIYKIIVTGDTGEINLGTCIPAGTYFSLETSLPVKAVGTGTLSFRVISPGRDADEIFIPVSSDNPFPYIARLHSSRLAKRNGIAGILLRVLIL